jgi:hypothetical protein
MEFSRYNDELDGRHSIPRRGYMFMFSTAIKPALGTTKPCIQTMPEALSLE